MKSLSGNTHIVRAVAVALVGLASLAALAGCGANAVTTLAPLAVTPMTVAVNPTTHRFYVPNGGANTVSVFDGTTNSSQATVSVQPDGVWPTGIAINAATNNIYITDSTSGNLSVINGATNSVSSVQFSTGNYPNGVGHPLGVASNSTTNRVYVLDWLTDGTANNLYVLDASTNKVLGQVPVGGSATGVAVNTKTNTVYATGLIQVPSLVNGVPVLLNGVPVLVPEDVLTVINGKDNTLVTNIAITGNIGVAVDETTNTVYVVCTVSVPAALPTDPPIQVPAVVVINGSSNQVTATIPLGGSAIPNRPNVIAVNPLTHMVYVAMNMVDGNGPNAYQNDKAITVIDGTINAVTGTIVLPDFPNGVTVDPTAGMIYVAENSETTIINCKTLALTHMPVD